MDPGELNLKQQFCQKMIFDQNDFRTDKTILNQIMHNS